LLHFFGAYTEKNNLNMVIEYCENGSLGDYFQKPNIVLTWQQMFEWFSQTVEGIHVLHTWNPPLVHRDIKSLNLLLDKDLNIKVCDFGLSRYYFLAFVLICRFRTMSNLKTLAMLRGTVNHMI
jgi:serine/threonine protein kinase